jgi:hypothetical protein
MKTKAKGASTGLSRLTKKQMLALYEERQRLLAEVTLEVQHARLEAAHPKLRSFVLEKGRRNGLPPVRLHSETPEESQPSAQRKAAEEEAHTPVHPSSECSPPHPEDARQSSRKTLD